jgi:hypothetical protein
MALEVVGMTTRPWYAGRGVVASGVFLLLLTLTGVALSITGGSKATTTTVMHHRVVNTGGSRCNLPVGNTDPVVGPPHATWTLVGRIAAPSIPGVGPGITDGNDRRCYAHSPLGALLAAANFLPTTVAATDQRLGMDHYVAGHLRDIYAHQPAIPVDPGTSAQVVGFKAEPLGADAVDVSLALRINGVLGYVVLPMRWTKPGDWRLQLLSAAQPVDAGRLESMTDYIPWSGA